MTVWLAILGAVALWLMLVTAALAHRVTELTGKVHDHEIHHEHQKEPVVKPGMARVGFIPGSPLDQLQKALKETARNLGIPDDDAPQGEPPKRRVQDRPQA